MKFVIDDKFKLEDLIRLELHKFEDDVGEIVNRAQKEEKMEQALKKIASTWVNLEFVFSQHKVSFFIFLFSGQIIRNSSIKV